MNEIFKIEEKSLPEGIIKLQNEKNLYLYGMHIGNGLLLYWLNNKEKG